MSAVLSSRGRCRAACSPKPISKQRRQRKRHVIRPQLLWCAKIRLTLDARTGRSVGWMISISDGSTSMTVTGTVRFLRTDGATSATNVAITFCERCTRVKI